MRLKDKSSEKLNIMLEISNMANMKYGVWQNMGSGVKFLIIPQQYWANSG